MKYITVNPTRPARWWKRRPPTTHGCSFCGRTIPAPGRLINPADALFPRIGDRRTLAAWVAEMESRFGGPS